MEERIDQRAVAKDINTLAASVRLSLDDTMFDGSSTRRRNCVLEQDVVRQANAKVANAAQQVAAQPEDNILKIVQSNTASSKKPCLADETKQLLNQAWDELDQAANQRIRGADSGTRMPLMFLASKIEQSKSQPAAPKHAPRADVPQLAASAEHLASQVNSTEQAAPVPSSAPEQVQLPDVSKDKAAQAAAKAEKKKQKASKFLSKIRREVRDIADLKARRRRVDTIKGMLHKREDSLLAAGMKEETIVEFIASMERELVTKEAKREATKEARKKAPRTPDEAIQRSMSTASASSRQLVEPAVIHSPEKKRKQRKRSAEPALQNCVEKTQASQASSVLDRQASQEIISKPLHCEALDSKLISQRKLRPAKHREVLVGPSILRKLRRPPMARPSIRFLPDDQLVTEVKIRSYKQDRKKLWTSVGGKSLVCDACDKKALRSQGILMSDASRSQFMQERFVCHDCAMLENGGDATSQLVDGPGSLIHKKLDSELAPVDSGHPVV